LKNHEDILSKIKKGDRNAQKDLYEFYAPTFLAVCRRYLKKQDEAEDALLKGFFKIFSKINFYKEKGSFEGWMRKIIINECLMQLRQNKNFHLSLDQSFHEIETKEDIISEIDYKSLLKILDHLPTGYRTVFNMFIIEGYKHREIAEKLDISINTSKSQLIQAKKKLRQIIKKKLTYKSVQ